MASFGMHFLVISSSPAQPGRRPRTRPQVGSDLARSGGHPGRRLQIRPHVGSTFVRLWIQICNRPARGTAPDASKLLSFGCIARPSAHPGRRPRIRPQIGPKFVRCWIHICNRQSTNRKSQSTTGRGMHYERVLEQPHNGATTQYKGPSVSANRLKYE